MPRIDSHTHYFPQALVDQLDRRTAVPRLVHAGGERFIRYGADTQYPLQPVMTDLEGKLAAMDRLGVDVSVLSVNIPGVDGLGEEAAVAARAVNEELAAVCAQHPGRLAWLATLPLDDPRAVGRELRQAVDEGARGAMIYSNVAGRPLDLDADRALFETAAELDVPILMHPTFPLSGESVSDYDLVSILGFLFDTSTTTLRLVFGGLYDRYPELKLIVAHVASLIPYIIGRIDFQSAAWPGGRGALTVAPSEHLHKLYADSVCLHPPALAMALELLGADRIAFGSDLPYWPLDGAVDTLSALELDEATRAQVEHGTASALFGLEVTTAA